MTSLLFAALRGNEPRPIPEGYFRRTITQTQVEQAGEHVFITFTGTGFLYKMVRLMTGAAHEAARGKITLEELARLINAPLPDDKSPFCAPPDGLTLMRVHYQEKTFGDKKENKLKTAVLLDACRTVQPFPPDQLLHFPVQMGNRTYARTQIMPYAGGRSGFIPFYEKRRAPLSWEMEPRRGGKQ